MTVSPSVADGYNVAVGKQNLSRLRRNVDIRIAVKQVFIAVGKQPRLVLINKQRRAGQPSQLLKCKHMVEMRMGQNDLFDSQPLRLHGGGYLFDVRAGSTTAHFPEPPSMI